MLNDFIQMFRNDNVKNEMYSTDLVEIVSNQNGIRYVRLSILPGEKKNKHTNVKNEMYLTDIVEIVSNQNGIRYVRLSILPGEKKKNIPK